jgi:hypothetical protein
MSVVSYRLAAIGLACALVTPANALGFPRQTASHIRAVSTTPPPPERIASWAIRSVTWFPAVTPLINLGMLP